MTITYTIPGATLLDQLASTTLDGLPANDANDDCVPTSIAEGLHILTGKVYDGDELKDAVYGAAYVGFQSAARYIQYCHDRGVTLAPHNGSQSDLVATIHAEVDAGHPVIVTMPSQWGTAPADPVHPSGSTHVGLAVGTGPGEIRVMNPWHGFYQDQSDAWWQARLCEGQVWPMQKAAGASMSGVPSGWTDSNGVLTAPAAPDGKQYSCIRGMRDFVMANNWDPSDVPVDNEQGVDEVEIGHAALGGGVVQWFLKSGQLSWVQGFNGNACFRTYNGQEEKALRAALDTAKSDLTAAQSAVTQAQSQATVLQSQLSAAQQSAAAAAAGLQTAQASLSAEQSHSASLQSQLSSAQSQIAQLQAQIATLKSQPAPTPTPTPAPAPATPAPTTPADAAALLVSLIYAEAEATLKAVTPA